MQARPRGDPRIRQLQGVRAAPPGSIGARALGAPTTPHDVGRRRFGSGSRSRAASVASAVSPRSTGASTFSARTSTASNAVTVRMTIRGALPRLRMGTNSVPVPKPPEIAPNPPLSELARTASRSDAFRLNHAGWDSNRADLATRLPCRRSWVRVPSSAPRSSCKSACAVVSAVNGPIRVAGPSPLTESGVVRA
jgi:hypothetical protein